MKYHQEIIHILRYFAFFSYAPNRDEIHMFFPVKISENDLKKELNSFQKITGMQENRYTLGEYNIGVESLESKVRSSLEKINSVKMFVRILSWFPQVKLIGLSGSVAMMNAEADDDIDLFIVTAANRIWTVRIIGLFLATIMGRRRNRGETHAPNKICLNLFFDEQELVLPSNKRSEYGAHEVLQMKPLLVKDDMYRKFLKQNEWVFEKFPNAKVYAEIPRLFKAGGSRRVGRLTLSAPLLPQKEGSLVSSFFETIAKKFQLSIIRKHHTTETITSTQLWFFPDDFEKKIPK